MARLSGMQGTLAAVGCAAALLLIWLLYGCWRTRLTFAQYLLLITNFAVAKLLWRARVTGPLPVADDAGAVIVSNHRCSVEPLLIQLSTNRVVHWMVAREYVEAPGLSLLFRTLQSIPVGRRGVDTKATKRAIRLARERQLVGLFPEGRINATEDVLLPGRPGAALIALKAGVPVIPCYIEGANFGGNEFKPFYTLARVTIHVGQPIDVEEYLAIPDSKAAQRKLTERMLSEIAALAGVKDFTPRLAGRRWSPADDSTPENSSSAPGGAKSAADDPGRPGAPAN